MFKKALEKWCHFIWLSLSQVTVDWDSLIHLFIQLFKSVFVVLYTLPSTFTCTDVLKSQLYFCKVGLFTMAALTARRTGTDAGNNVPKAVRMELDSNLKPVVSWLSWLRTVMHYVEHTDFCFCILDKAFSCLQCLMNSSAPG